MLSSTSKTILSRKGAAPRNSGVAPFFFAPLERGRAYTNGRFTTVGVP